MILPDVNVLVIAFRRGAAGHPEHAAWLKRVVESDELYGMSPQVLSSVIRIATNRRIFPHPASLRPVLQFCETLLDQPNCRVIQPGARHWRIFSDLSKATKATGNPSADAWLAALAIESGCEWITRDRDFARFPGLRWRGPF
jgi:hypothetical protein